MDVSTEDVKHSQAEKEQRGDSLPTMDLSRRGFLGRAGSVTAATLAAGTLSGLPLPRIARAGRLRSPARQGVPVGGRARADHAYLIRLTCAEDQHRYITNATPNGDELAYGTRIGNFTKGLPHDGRGEVDPVAYSGMLSALLSARPADFEAIPLGGTVKFANPQGAYAYVLEGTDAGGIAVPPAPSFSSAQEAEEMAELYWQALARDVPFSAYATHPLIGQAAADLSKLSGFQGPKMAQSGAPGTIFQAGLTGEQIGPYISQFLWMPVPYGAMTMSQLYPIAPSQEYLTTFDAWLAVQQGRFNPSKPTTSSTLPALRYIVAGRDLATYLHADFTYQAYLNVALILNKLGLLNKSNPYLHSRTQVGACTFGAHHVLELVAKAGNAAVKASWYHKWLVHRRLRPEEFGGRVHLQKTGLAASPIHTDLLTTSGVLDAVYGKYGSYLLPQAYPEGSPMHPSYPAAHPAITGACVTILKAFFDETAALPNPVIASDDGSSLASYSGQTLTVGGELNKLAGNLAMGRGFGSVHWRSDNLAGLQLGEAVALGMLADERRTSNEQFGGFSFTRFDGSPITILARRRILTRRIPQVGCLHAPLRDIQKAFITLQ